MPAHPPRYPTPTHPPSPSASPASMPSKPSTPLQPDPPSATPPPPDSTPIRSAISLGILALLAVIGVMLLPPIPQDPSYHHFADQRAWLGIPNAADVLSNLPFLLTGAAGCLMLWPRRAPSAQFTHPQEWRAAITSCIALMLTACGSAYYHWSPDTIGLAWDRLPITLVFISIFSLIVMERISPILGWRIFCAGSVLGVASVGYWLAFNDLRFYGVIQFFPLAALPLLLWRYPARYNRVSLLYGTGGSYVLAKFCEHYDSAIMALTADMVSGHTLKHLAAALAAAFFITYLVKRCRLSKVIH